MTLKTTYRHPVSTGLFILVAGLGLAAALATEQAPYEKVLQDGIFEVRDYPAIPVAETVVEGSVEDAGSKSFRTLFAYISGDNAGEEEIAMTAPVTQTPVNPGAGTNRRWAVTFTMPSGYTLQTLPQPRSPAVTLRLAPAARYAVIRYSGFWSEEAYRRHELQLEQWIADRGFERSGEAVWARYNSPLTPWFLRHNEILIPIRGGPRTASS